MSAKQERLAELERNAAYYEDSASFWRYAGQINMGAYDERKMHECRAEARKLRRKKRARKS